MVRAFTVRGLAVHVYNETARGSRHHLPHAHIERRGQRVGSVYLISQTVYDCREQLHADVLQGIAAQKERLLEMWSELNPDD